jgi:hypothetical protein
LSYEYAFDETGLPDDSFNPAKALYQFIYDNWTLAPPISVNDIVWRSWSFNRDYLTIQFWEEVTGRSPMGTNWRMGSYLSVVGIYMFAQMDQGQIPDRVNVARSHIDSIISKDPEAMRSYGISGFKVRNFEPTRKLTYPSVTHKTSNYEYVVYVELYYTKSRRLVV